MKQFQCQRPPNEQVEIVPFKVAESVAELFKLCGHRRVPTVKLLRNLQYDPASWRNSLSPARFQPETPELTLGEANNLVLAVMRDFGLIEVA